MLFSQSNAYYIYMALFAGSDLIVCNETIDLWSSYQSRARAYSAKFGSKRLQDTVRIVAVAFVRNRVEFKLGRAGMRQIYYPIIKRSKCLCSIPNAHFGFFQRNLYRFELRYEFGKTDISTVGFCANDLNCDCGSHYSPPRDTLIAHRPPLRGKPPPEFEM